jgi:hypothetical protein
MDTFNNDPSVTALLISLKAGGVVRTRFDRTRMHTRTRHNSTLTPVKPNQGLNLTVASVVFLMDPWWNPAGEEQAMDRVHRLGQTKDVKCVRFVIQVRCRQPPRGLATASRLLMPWPARSPCVCTRTHTHTHTGLGRGANAKAAGEEALHGSGERTPPACMCACTCALTTFVVCACACVGSTANRERLARGP